MFNSLGLFGGTSLIIMVGVAIDTIQLNSYLLNKHYDGLMKSGKAVA
jgi:preprotein translocase subunit SecY